MIQHLAAPGIVGVVAIRILFVNVITRVVFASFFGYCHEYRIIGLRFTQPFLQKEHARFGASVWLKSVSMKPDNCENAGLVKKIIADIFHIGIIEYTLGQNDCHSSAGVEHIKRAFNEENVPLHFVYQSTFFLAEYILVQKPLIFYLTCKRRVGEQNIKIHIMECFFVFGIISAVAKFKQPCLKF